MKDSTLQAPLNELPNLMKTTSEATSAYFVDIITHGYAHPSREISLLHTRHRQLSKWFNFNKRCPTLISLLGIFACLRMLPWLIC
jgi:hypothetical protein